MLERLLRDLAVLRTDDLFGYSVSLVDNDKHESARSVVARITEQTALRIRYDVEPAQNISLARNRSVRNADGSLIAFIDDDEFPPADWLLHHVRMLLSSRVDGVLGPVMPHFDGKAPAWLVRSGLLERRNLETGEIIKDSKDTRTGNVLIRRDVCSDGEDWFDPKFGNISGGDQVFFRGRMNVGKVFVWCREAYVFETVPVERQTRMYYVRRACTRGLKEAWTTRFLSAGTAKSLVAVSLYTPALPVLFFVAHHLFVRMLVKDCDHLSKILGHLGIALVRQRPP